MQTEQLLRKLVEMAGGASAEGGYILALDSEGLERVPDAVDTGKATWTVVQPQTELGLRRVLWKSGGAPFIALISRDLAARLSNDILRRARRGRVHVLDANDILSIALRVPVTGTEDEAVKRLALENLEAIREAMTLRTLPTIVDQRLLDELLLDVCVGQRLRSEAPGKLLADWLQQKPAWAAPIMTQDLPRASGGDAPERETNAVRALLRRNLSSMHGTAGRVLTWALDTPGGLRAIVVRGPLLALDAKLGVEVWGELTGALRDAEVGLTEDVLRATVVDLAKVALEALGDAAAPYLTEAETLGRRLVHASVLARSALLPLGLDNRCEAAAKQAARGEAVPASEIVWMRAHRSMRLRESEIDLVEELARLSRYLAEPEAGEASTEASNGGGTVDQVRRYQRSGAFADLAATRLGRARAASTSHHREADLVLEAYSTRRNRENLAFAETLAGGYTKGINAKGVTPLHRIWTEVVLRQDPSLRRSGGAGGLYLVVMDGCSYPVFLELLYDLSRQVGQPIGLPLSGEAAGIPALSLLPTITSHARGATFLGEIPKDPWIPEAVFRDQGERTTDPGRFRQNGWLGDRSRKLFLKGDLADSGRALLDALAGGSIDVVAAVFNAVDDQIGSANTGAMLKVRPHDISGFVPSLRAALAAGRRVLLTADHGHTPFVKKELCVGKGTSARYRELADGEAAPEGFLEIDLSGQGGTPGRKAFAWRLGAYQGSPQVGFHGGASLEEMVVPLAWLVEGGLEAASPAWWYGGGVPIEEPVATPKKAVKKAERPAPAQAPLLDVRRVAEAPARDLDRWPLDEAVKRALDDAEKAALALVAENGAVRASDLARRVGKPLARLDPFMTQLNRKLHAHGVRWFSAEKLESGEMQYVYLHPKGAA